MFKNFIHPDLRGVSIVTLLQTGVVVFGTLFVSAILKLKGYRSGSVPDSFFREDALFIRHYGFLLLLIPACWAIFAIIAIHIEARQWIQAVILAAGMLLILLGPIYYIAVTLSPTKL